MPPNIPLNTTPAVPPQAPMPPSITPPPRKKKWPYIVGGVVLLILAAFFVLFKIITSGGGPTGEQPDGLTSSSTPPVTDVRATESRTVQAIPPLPGEWWGAGDPSVIDGESRGVAYQSFSDIVPSHAAAGPALVSVSLAQSSDNGATWSRIGTVAQAVKLSNDLFEMNETSTLVHDPSDASLAAYKLLWLRFLQKDGEPDWHHSWVAIKTAPSPEGAWSAPQKLIAGKAYDPNDTSNPEPRKPLFELPSQMQDCIILQEPAALEAAGGFYLGINCISVKRPTGNRLELLKFTHRSPGQTSLEYKGKMLTYDDASRFRDAYRGQYPELAKTEELGASHMFTLGGRTYLLASPVTAVGTYLGCGLFEIIDIGKASVRRDAKGVPLMLKYLQGDTGATQRGACTYSPNSTQSGITMFEVKMTPGSEQPMHPSIINTGVQFP